MKKWLSWTTCIILLALLLIACTPAKPKLVLTEEQLHGVWKTTLPPSVGNGADLTLDFVRGEDGIDCFASSTQLAFRYVPAQWSESDGMYTFTISGNQIFPLTLHFQAETADSLRTTAQEGTTEVLLNKVDGLATNGNERIEPVEMSTYTVEERMEQLRRFPEYASPGEPYSINYKLGDKSSLQPLNDAYGLAQAVEGKTDIELMVAVLDWTCSHFPHDGTSGNDHDNTAVGIAEFSKKNGGVNCYGLSVLMSEVLRAYGVEAKAISCYPIETMSVDNHVVVHAYSKAQGKWVFLDPTYRLFLRDEDGRYMSLPELRQIILDEKEPYYCNPYAGWNGNGFYWGNYRDYMTKNCFRFTEFTSFYSEETDGIHELVPLGYRDPFWGGELTSDAEAFWAVPNGE